jgi:hypothetical protein
VITSDELQIGRTLVAHDGTEWLLAGQQDDVYVLHRGDQSRAMVLADVQLLFAAVKPLVCSIGRFGDASA